MYIAFIYEFDTRQAKLKFGAHAHNIANNSIYWKMLCCIGPIADFSKAKALYQLLLKKGMAKYSVEFVYKMAKTIGVDPMLIDFVKDSQTIESKKILVKDLIKL